MSKKKLIPELRFSEFTKDEEWLEKRLGDVEVSRFVSKKIDGEKLTVDNYISTDNMLPDYSGIAKASRLPTTDRVTEYIEGDVLISNIRPYLKKVWKADRKGGASNDVLVFRSGASVKSEFLEYVLKNDAFINYVMRSAKGVKMPRGDKDFMLEYPVVVPHPQEQQKIASCLSSLDELIAAHTDKLEVLKDHKKGLLQNLFPQEGQKVPEYRFPEFEKDGEWELSPFSKFIKLYRGSSPRPISDYLTKAESGVNWIKIGDTGTITDFVIRSVSEKITPKGAEKSRKVKKGELILANSMSYGYTYQLALDGCIYDGWFVLREYEEVFDKQFLLQSLNSDYMQDQYKKLAAGGIVKNISSEIVYSTLIPNTSRKEQQKIASCLSAVDELITEQTEKIEQLQQHKKGLMQGLFPQIEN